MHFSFSKQQVAHKAGDTHVSVGSVVVVVVGRARAGLARHGDGGRGLGGRAPCPAPGVAHFRCLALTLYTHTHGSDGSTLTRQSSLTTTFHESVVSELA